MILQEEQRLQEITIKTDRMLVHGNRISFNVKVNNDMIVTVLELFETETRKTGSWWSFVEEQTRNKITEFIDNRPFIEIWNEIKRKGAE